MSDAAASDAKVIRQRFGSNLREARESAGLSVRELARLCGRSPGWVSRLETGQREVGVVSIVRLARALHIDAATLVSGQR